MSSGSSRGDVLGYNQEQVEAIGVGINSMVERAGEAITTAIKTNIVDKVAEEWYSEVAVKFFEEFRQSLKNAEPDITEIFEGFSRIIQQAGDDWATETGGVAPTMPAVEEIKLDLDVSNIKADDAGNRYITENLDESIKQYVENARMEIMETFGQLKAEAQADAALFGEGQSQGVEIAAERLGDYVNKTLDNLINGNDSIIERIAYFKNQYQEVAQKNTQRFEDSAFTE